LTFSESFEEISENQGIAFLFLDPNESNPQLLHHPKVLGGDWTSPSKSFFGILGFKVPLKPIQIIQRSIKEVKSKSFTTKDFIDSFENPEKFINLKNPKSEFYFCNIIPIPQFLMKNFINLEKTDPYSIAKAFIETV